MFRVALPRRFPAKSKTPALALPVPTSTPMTKSLMPACVHGYCCWCSRRCAACVLCVGSANEIPLHLYDEKEERFISSAEKMTFSPPPIFGTFSDHATTSPRNFSDESFRINIPSILLATLIFHFGVSKNNVNNFYATSKNLHAHNTSAVAYLEVASVPNEHISFESKL